MKITIEVIREDIIALKKIFNANANTLNRLKDLFKTDENKTLEFINRYIDSHYFIVKYDANGTSYIINPLIKEYL